MSFEQVARILHYKDTGTVRRLTNLHPDAGGLPYVEFGCGRRKMRLVRREDLIAFIERGDSYRKLTLTPASLRPIIRRKSGVNTGPRSLLDRFGKQAKR